MAELRPPPRLTSQASLNKVAAVLNAASGGVGPQAGERIKAICGEHGIEIEPRVVAPQDIAGALKAAVDERPDVLIVLAGDGTLALSAELCGADGPLLAALPGGTMNMLPFALNGRMAWPEALTALLQTGRPLDVSGGTVGGRSFYVAAILGEAVLYADVREAIRKGRVKLALLRAQRALKRSFKGRLRFQLDGGPTRKSQALSLMCPLVSRGLKEDVGLEAAELDPKDVLELVRLGLSTLGGGWRSDPSVTVEVCSEGRAWAHGRVHAILDGEPHRFDSPVALAYRAKAFRALAPADSPAFQAEASSVHEAGATARSAQVGQEDVRPCG